jgi:hypothetical protein
VFSQGICEMWRAEARYVYRQYADVGAWLVCLLIMATNASAQSVAVPRPLLVPAAFERPCVIPPITYYPTCPSPARPAAICEPNLPTGLWPCESFTEASTCFPTPCLPAKSLLRSRLGGLWSLARSESGQDGDASGFVAVVPWH